MAVHKVVPYKESLTQLIKKANIGDYIDQEISGQHNKTQRWVVFMDKTMNPPIKSIKLVNTLSSNNPGGTQPQNYGGRRRTKRRHHKKRQTKRRH